MFNEDSNEELKEFMSVDGAVTDEQLSRFKESIVLIDETNPKIGKLEDDFMEQYWDSLEVNEVESNEDVVVTLWLYLSYACDPDDKGWEKVFTVEEKNEIIQKFKDYIFGEDEKLDLDEYLKRVIS